MKDVPSHLIPCDLCDDKYCMLVCHPSYEPIATMFDELRQGIRQVDCEHFTGKKEEEIKPDDEMQLELFT
jgi:hypothetical protein